MYQLKDSIPVPSRRTAGRPAMQYPLADMAVGQSFFVAVTEPDTGKKVAERLQTKIARWRKSTKSASKFRVAEHECPDTLAPAVGVWRTA